VPEGKNRYYWVAQCKGENVANTTKHDLVTVVSNQTGLTQSDTKIVVEELLNLVGEILSDGRTIEIRGFGTFHIKVRKPRPARNPKTGDVVPLFKRVVPLFKYSAELKQSISTSLKASQANGSIVGALSVS
jgi:nucleoid DNA-binding protein